MNAQDARGADMNSIEDRIAAATRAAAQTVTPSSVPPLSLPAARGRRGWRWRGLAPVMAAVVVVVIILAAVVGRDVLSTGKAAPGPPAASPSSVAALVRSGQIPAFYVLLTRSSQPGAGPVAAVVHATATGRALATVKPTSGRTIVAASMAADDRTFVLDEEPWTAKGRAGQAPGTLVLVRLTASGQAGSVTPPQLKPFMKVFTIDPGRFDAQTAYAAVNTLRLDDMRPHIYRTHDGGKTWTAITGGMPDNAPRSTFLWEPG